jgi:hypothetical protein
MPILQMVTYPVEKKWKPWANTYIYYPFTSNLVDQMWNGNTGTMTWTCTFDSSTGIHVTWRSGNYVTWLSNWINNRNLFTWNVWVKAETTTQASYLIWKATAYASTQAQWVNVYSDIQIWICVGNTFYQWWVTQDQKWHNMCLVEENNTTKIYIDWNLISTQSWWTVNNVSEMQLWWWWQYGTSRACDGYIKDYIVETIAWTADEVSAYYNQTKSNYWL